MNRSPATGGVIPVVGKDGQPLNLYGRAVFVLIILYLFMNRAIPDIMVVPIGISVRPSEIVLLLVLAAWAVWIVTDPHPFPVGLVGLVGLLVIAVLVFAPFLHALNVSRFQANGAERGIVKLILYGGLFVASYHMSYRRRFGKALLATVLVVSIAQALLGVYEFVTRQPLTFMFDLAEQMGLVLDPNGVRSELASVFTRYLTGEIRATGLAPHPIVLSAILALALLLMGIWLIYSEGLRQRVLVVLGALVVVVALPTPNSRTAFVILGFSVLPLMLLMINHLPRTVLLFVGFVIALGAGFVLSPETPELLLNSVFEAEDDATTQVRIERFDVLPDLVEQRPIIGAGYLTHLILTVWWFLLCLVRAWSGTVRSEPADAILTASGVAGVLAILAGALTFDAWTFDQFLPMCLIVIGLGVGRSDVVLRQWRLHNSALANATSRTVVESVARA